MVGVSALHVVATDSTLEVASLLPSPREVLPPQQVPVTPLQGEGGDTLHYCWVEVEIRSLFCLY